MVSHLRFSTRGYHKWKEIEKGLSRGKIVGISAFLEPEKPPKVAQNRALRCTSGIWVWTFIVSTMYVY